MHKDYSWWTKQFIKHKSISAFCCYDPDIRSELPTSSLKKSNMTISGLLGVYYPLAVR